jgi:hypothetical protein
MARADGGILFKSSHEFKIVVAPSDEKTKDPNVKSMALIAVNENEYLNLKSMAW